ncbi:uncharacterized protein (TIGR03083 family) [Kibdelosporangium banguiense]|uniref:Uncharacterized protein (TIGR03083 family) n=1 Tax=Kibdelosporangium banguiense TaxID=1365924 RepID=A0ABS4TIE5_9PSEU|nr:maleylpyruvate isomerase family mycothiol-dependent enzyme [Kibdelosporangium banguiense]MBP2324169.1 uncharacterized protein (TIGR03083 family) [Kibdelosporangium banguiense]
MDYLAHFRREILEFEAAVRQVPGDAPLIASCPGWSTSDLVAHLGGVQRYVIRLISTRATVPPDPMEISYMRLPADTEGWPMPDTAPNLGLMPAGLIDWFAEGAAELAELFATTASDTPVWTWSREQTAGFWLEMQTIEAAVHRWDANNQPIDHELARSAIEQTFTVMAPFRRARQKAPAGQGERFRFTDGTISRTVQFSGDDVQLVDGSGDVELLGTASDLMLFLWQRVPADHFDITGDREVLDRYFTLVPPV